MMGHKRSLRDAQGGQGEFADGAAADQVPPDARQGLKTVFSRGVREQRLRAEEYRRNYAALWAALRPRRRAQG